MIQHLQPRPRTLGFAALLVATLSAQPSHARAQHSGGATAKPALVSAAPQEGAQFDFLVGQWEVTARPKATTLAQRIHGVPKVLGTWKAWRALDGWGLEDELRLTDGSGNPLVYTHTMRFFESARRRWSNSGIDVYKGTRTTSTAEWRGGEMVVSGLGTDETGKAFVSRATFAKITPSTFTYRLDRSFDRGRTWTEGVTTIDAKRVSATAPR